MYIYEKGVVSDCFELMSKLNNFIENRTTIEIVSYRAIDDNNSRKGKHLCLKFNNNSYFNINASDYANPCRFTESTTELSDNTSFKTLSYLAVNPSTGFNSSNVWNQQPGYFGRNISLPYDPALGAGYPLLFCNNIDQDNFCKYYFLVSEDNNHLCIITEFSANEFSYNFFGLMNNNQYAIASTRLSYYQHNCGISKYVASNNTGNPVGNLILRNNHFVKIAVSGSNRESFSVKINNKLQYESLRNSTLENKFCGTFYSDYNSYDHRAKHFTFPFHLLKSSSINYFNEYQLFKTDFYGSDENLNYFRIGNIEDCELINMKGIESEEIKTIYNNKYLIIPINRNENPHTHDHQISFGIGLAFRISNYE